MQCLKHTSGETITTWCMCALAALRGRRCSREHSLRRSNDMMSAMLVEVSGRSRPRRTKNMLCNHTQDCQAMHARNGGEVQRQLFGRSIRKPCENTCNAPATGSRWCTLRSPMSLPSQAKFSATRPVNLVIAGTLLVATGSWTAFSRTSGPFCMLTGHREVLRVGTHACT